MDTNTSFNLQRAEAQTCTSTEPSQVLPHSSSLEEVNIQLPLPATVTVSRDLVEDLLVQLMLRLNPLRGYTGSHLTQQQLLTLCLHMSAVTLETLRKVPGVIVDEKLPLPPCNTWKAAVLLQSSVVKKFGTSIQVRKLLVRKDPALLNFIPHHIIEGVLITDETECAGEFTPTQTASDQESRLFSQFLPESIKEEIFEQHGSWIRYTKVFQKAFPRITDEEIMEYKQRFTEPRLSNRDVVWVDKKYFLADFYEEVETEALTLNPNLAGWLFTDHSKDQGLVSSTEGKHHKAKTQNLKSHQLCTFQFMAGDCHTERVDLIADTVKESTIRSVMVEFFRSKNLYRPEHPKTQAFEKEMVEHIHLLLQKEAKKYRKNRVFLQNLKRLEDSKNEIKLSRELCQPLKITLCEALPNTWLSREGLMQDVRMALVACSLIAAEIINHLKPTVSFAADTKPPDWTPYNINIPIKRVETEPKRELTQLELRLQEERAQAREELFYAETETTAAQPEKTETAAQPEKTETAAQPEKTKKKTKKKKLISWLSKLVRWRKS